MVLSFPLRDERVDKMDVSRVFYKHSNRVAREVQAGSLGKGRKVLMGALLRQAEVRTKHYRNSDTEVQELREELKRYKNAEKKQGMQCEPAGEEGRLEEDGKMEVGEEVDSKKLDQKKKELQKQLRDLEKLTCTPQDIQSRLKEECFKRLSTRGISCLSTNGCGRNVTSCKVSRANRNSGNCNGDMERIRDEECREGGPAPRTGTTVPEDSLGRSGVG